MTSSSRAWLVLAIVFVLGSAFLYRQLEWVEREVDGGYGEEASRNPYLAAELFLNELDIPTETVVGMGLLDDLPPIGEAIVMSAPRESLSARRREKLVDWVEEGGTLVVVAHSLYDPETGGSADLLMDELGVFLVDPSSEESAEGDAEGDVEEAGQGDNEAEVARTKAAPSAPSAREIASPEGDESEDSSDDAPARTFGEILTKRLERPECRSDAEGIDAVSVGRGLDVEIELELSSANELQVYEERVEDAYFSRESQMLALPYGEGAVIAVTSFQPFSNPRIHCHDHAYFLWLTVDDQSKVWMIHDPDMRSLAGLAFANMPASMWGGIGLILLFVAMSSLRFGLTSFDLESPRREHLEHLHASVTFKFRQGGFGALYRRLHADLLARAPREREAWTRRAGVGEGEAWRALSDDVPRKRREITERIAMMLRMRRTR